MAHAVFRSLGIMGKTFSPHDDDSTSFRQLGPDFENIVAQLVTRMNMAEHDRCTQYKRINHHITHFAID